jgi:opacity protein-like surface antigen
MNKKMTAKLLMTSLALMSMSVFAEPYVAASLGWTFNQKLSGIKGDENLNYPDSTSSSLYFPDTTYTDIKLKDVLQGGLKTGYFFESSPNLGIELEANYSEPKMKGQNVTLSNPNPNSESGLGLGETISYGTGTSASNPLSATEAQLPAKVQLLQFNLNAIYRYQGFKEITSYIGGGPSLNIIRITGTGESGHFIDPTDPDGTQVVPNSEHPYVSRVHNTSINLGANFKIGAEYHLDKDWGLGAEYHYNWVPVDIKHFRSANNLNADLEMQSVSLVLTRHF